MEIHVFSFSLMVLSSLILCYVSRLILIAEKAAVYEKFPTPLINRLEKHFVLTKSILTDWQHAVLEIFDDWIDQFCNIEDLNRFLPMMY